MNKTLVLISFLIVFQAGSVLADSATLQERLERDVVLKLEDVTIAEALEWIGKEAGVTIELSDEAIWELPEGADTRLSVSLGGQLAQSLEEMLNAFFMRYAVGSKAVVIYPRPELKHIMGRPTPETLEVLRNIYTKSMLIQGEAKDIEKMGQALISQMAGKDVLLFPVDAMRFLVRTVGQMVEGNPKGVTVTLGPILDETAKQMRRNPPCDWFVCAAEFPSKTAQIRIMSRKEFNEVTFDRVVDISFESVTGLTILKQLAVIADVELEFEGEDRDWLDQAISIDALNVTVREALSRVTASLGGTGIVRPDGVYTVWRVERESPASRDGGMGGAKQKSSDTPGDADDDYVGKISIPMDGGRYFIEFMLRESDLTEELRQLRAERIKEILQAASTEAEGTSTP